MKTIAFLTIALSISLAQSTTFLQDIQNKKPILKDSCGGAYVSNHHDCGGQTIFYSYQTVFYTDYYCDEEHPYCVEAEIKTGPEETWNFHGICQKEKPALIKNYSVDNRWDFENLKNWCADDDWRKTYCDFCPTKNSFES